MGIILNEEDLKKIIFKHSNLESQNFWIKSISRQSPDDYEGMVVEIASKEDSTVSTIKLGKNQLKKIFIQCL